MPSVCGIETSIHAHLQVHWACQAQLPPPAKSLPCLQVACVPDRQLIEHPEQAFVGPTRHDVGSATGSRTGPDATPGVWIEARTADTNASPGCAAHQLDTLRTWASLASGAST